MMANSKLLNLIGADVPLRKVANTYGGEYAGPCPFCGGTDRFRVWPNEGESGRYKCMGHQEGRAGCGRSGDAIQYLRDHDGLSYREACARLGLEPRQTYHFRPEWPTGRSARYTPLPAHAASEPLAPPNSDWQEAAWQFVFVSISHLHAPEGAEALRWLQRRGLNPETISHNGLGYNPVDRSDERTIWGLRPETRRDGTVKRVWLPKGIVIPWAIHGQLWRVNIRRLEDDPKYIGPAGWRDALYHADLLEVNRPAVLVEGELDALTVQQAAGDLAVAVATGSTAGARKVKWLARLALASVVLVAFDADAAGEKAVHYWLDMLPKARRWRPFWQDANAMAQDGVDIRTWIKVGLASPDGG